MREAALVQIVVYLKAELPRRCALTMIGDPSDLVMSSNLAAFGTFSITYVRLFCWCSLIRIIKFTQCRKGSDFGESKPGVDPAMENAWQGGVANTKATGSSCAKGSDTRIETSWLTPNGCFIAS